MPPGLFAFVIFEIGSHFMPWPAWTSVFLFVLPSSLNDRHVPPSPDFYWLGEGSPDLFDWAVLKEWASCFLPPLSYN
jgi:hypothetical protein